MNAPPSGGAPVPSRLVIASRRSALARVQAQEVGRLIGKRWPEIRLKFLDISTQGDRILDQPLPELGGKGIFTEELDRLLVSGEADLAVHSLKDLPTACPTALDLLAVPAREDCRDVLISRQVDGWEGLKAGARVGTSSLRRQALALRKRPDCKPESIRGNVETRLRKLEEGVVDALILAAAGLSRLAVLETKVRSGAATFLDPRLWIPAPGQGALGVQGRSDDGAVRRVAAGINDVDARMTVEAERALLAELEGGCQLPLGAYARRTAEGIVLRVIVLAPDGSDVEVGEATGPEDDPAGLGRSLAEELKARGVDRLLSLAGP